MTGADRRLVALLGGAIFFEGYGRSLVTVALAYVGSDLGASSDALSYALAAITLGSLGVLALGPIADRVGRRRLLLASLALFGLFGGGTALAGSLAGLVAWQLAARVFLEGALFTAAVLAAEETSPASRAAAQGALGTMNALGAGFAAVLLAAVEVVPGGWRALCLVSLVPLALVPFLRRRVPESRHWLAHRGPRLTLPPAAWRGRVAATLVVVALAMSYDVAAFAFATYVPVERHGWSAPEVSAMFIGAGALGLPGWSVGGMLADRYGRRPIGVIFLVGLTAAELVFFLGGRLALWPGFAAMVFFQGGKMTIIRAWAAELFPTSFRGAAAGWLTAAGALGGMSGLAAAGALAGPAGGIHAALALVSVAGVLAAAAVLAWLPETRGIDLGESA
ncbi:MAG: MFS transporter [Deltaproteobacteria bacterium]|nr:MFS transporter [Deltaproteobacteria bacterium]